MTCSILTSSRPGSLIKSILSPSLSSAISGQLDFDSRILPISWCFLSLPLKSLVTRTSARSLSQEREAKRLPATRARRRSLKVISVLGGENISNSTAQSGHQSGHTVRKRLKPNRSRISSISSQFFQNVSLYGAPC